jgi:RNA polymerase sigma factor (sigma-70 family)
MSSIPDHSDSKDRKSETLKNSLGAVWDLHSEQLRRRARTRLRQYGLTGQAESMDICNDVMADLARHATNSTTPDEVLAYILRAIDNQVVDTFRTLARQCRDFRRNDPTSIEEMPISGSSVSPSVIALRREILDRIRSMLPAQDNLAIDMMLEKRDWNEIGQAIGMKPDAVRMRVRRAIEKVREKMVNES